MFRIMTAETKTSLEIPWNMQVSTEIRDDILIAVISGSITSANGSALAEHGELLQCKRKTVIDLANVDFLDSAGLGSLVKIVREYRQADTPLAFASPGPFVLKTLAMTRLDKVVPIRDDIAAAVEYLKGK